MKITFISTPDGEWEMLFFGNDLEADGHSIWSTQLLRYLDEYLPITITSAEVKELTWEALEKFDYEFPKRLSEFDEDDFTN